MQRGQAERGGVVGPLGADGGEHHHRPVGRRAQQVAHHLPRRLVDPLEVVDDEQHGPRAGARGHQRQRRLEQPVALGGRAHGRKVARRRGDPAAQLGHQAAELRQLRRELGIDLAHRRRRVPDLIAHRLHERLVADEWVLVAAPVEHVRSGAVHALCERGREPGLADPGLAGDEHEPGAAAADAHPRAVERLQRGVAADERAARVGLEHARKRRAARLGARRRGAAGEERVQRVPDHGGGARPILGALCEQPRDEAGDRLRHVRVDLAHVGRRHVDDLEDHLRRAADVGRPAAQHLEQARPERVEVAALVDLRAGRLLRRHVGGRADDRVLARDPLGVGDERHAEVAQQRLVVVAEPDVARLDVAVHDPARVRVGQRVGGVARDPQRLPQRKRAVGAEALGHRAAGDVLADEVRGPLVLADVVHGDSVRVIPEPGHRADLARHALALGLVRRHAREEAERHLAVELEVAREVHALARPLAEVSLDPVAPAGDRQRRRRLAGERGVVGRPRAVA
jgi:hypothetical protein